MTKENIKTSVQILNQHTLFFIYLSLRFIFCLHISSGLKLLHTKSQAIPLIVLILDGYLEIDAHVGRNLFYSIYFRHFIRSIEVTQRIISEKTYLTSCVRNMFRFIIKYMNYGKSNRIAKTLSCLCQSTRKTHIFIIKQQTVHRSEVTTKHGKRQTTRQEDKLPL